MEDKPSKPILCPFRVSVLILSIVLLVSGWIIIGRASLDVAIGLLFLFAARYSLSWLHKTFMRDRAIAMAEEMQKKLSEAMKSAFEEAEKPKTDGK